MALYLPEGPGGEAGHVNECFTTFLLNGLRDKREFFIKAFFYMDMPLQIYDQKDSLCSIPGGFPFHHRGAVVAQIVKPQYKYCKSLVRKAAVKNSSSTNIGPFTFIKQLVSFDETVYVCAVIRLRRDASKY